VRLPNDNNKSYVEKPTLFILFYYNPNMAEPVVYLQASFVELNMLTETLVVLSILDVL
jgi:hypothetical protein